MPATSSSLLGRVDPRLKLIAALLLIIGILLTPDRALPAYPLLWALLASIAVISGVDAGRLARRAVIALPFALAAITLLFTTPGQPLITIAGLTVSDAGLLRFISIVLKSWLALQISLLLSLTTPFTDILAALTSLRLPSTLVLIISFMYRYLTVLQEESERLLRARASRSAALPDQRGGGSLWWRAQVAGGMVGNLFLRSYERSERVYAAMLSRGYQGQVRQLHNLSESPLTWQAILVAAAPILVMIGIQLAARLWWTR